MAKDLRKIFGNTSNNALARWLMANVLQQTGFYQVGEFPYAYFIRTEGIEKMLTLLAGEEGQKRRVQRAAKSTIYDVQKLANEEPAHGWLLG